MWKKFWFAAIVVTTTGLTSACVDRDWHERHYSGAYHDEDRDGVQNSRDGDRDGDGVVNSRDRYPDDPRYN